MVKVVEKNENPGVIVPTPRRGTRRGNNSKAPVNPETLYPMPKPAGRGRGRGVGKQLNQDKNAELLGPGVGGGGGHPGLGIRDSVGIPDLGGERSAGKLPGVEEEGSTSPIPERVSLFPHTSCYHLTFTAYVLLL